MQFLLMILSLINTGILCYIVVYLRRPSKVPVVPSFAPAADVADDVEPKSNTKELRRPKAPPEGL